MKNKFALGLHLSSKLSVVAILLITYSIANAEPLSANASCKIAFAADFIPQKLDQLSPLPRAAGGSTGGSWMSAPDGKQWFVKRDVKYPELQTSAEVISSEIYRRFGYRTAQTVKLEKNGSFYSASADLGLPMKNTDFSTLNDPKVRQMRIVAAYLKDWDRLGNPENNFVMDDGTLALIDFGGTLGARARGEFKPGEIASHAIGSFENSSDFHLIYESFSVNAPSSHPWNRITKQDISELVELFSKLSDDDLRSIVLKAHYSTTEDAAYMIDALIKRRDGIIHGLKQGSVQTVD